MPDPQQDADRLHISLAQVVASSLAAVSAAVICSFFGVAGTIIGTAIASASATIASALYAHSLRRTRSRLRRLHHPVNRIGFSDVVSTARKDVVLKVRAWPWRAIAAMTLGVFLIAGAVVTTIELIAGRPLASLIGNSDTGGSGTTLFGGTIAPAHHAKPTPTTTTPAATTSPTTSPTSTPTLTTSPTPSPSTSPSGPLCSLLHCASPSPSPTSSSGGGSG